MKITIAPAARRDLERQLDYLIELKTLRSR
jgi:plasmid stabilization system protein ParE